MATASTVGPVQRAVQDRLEGAFAPSWLEVVNESHLHNVPPGSEMHFKVVVVSERFAGLRAIARHRAVHGVLRDQLDGGIHALTITALTPEEWRERDGFVAPSPRCRGGASR